MTENPLHDQVVQSLNKRFYSQPLIDNVYRGDYVETLILFALGDGWEGVGGWGSWDLEKGVDGVRVEVKQSAALQTWWKQTGIKKSSPSFSITPKTGYYTDSTDAAKWVDLPGVRFDYLTANRKLVEAGRVRFDYRTACMRLVDIWRVRFTTAKRIDAFTIEV